MSISTTSAMVFDFDGTIVDSMNAFADIAAQVMPKRHDIDSPTARRRYLETSGIPFFQQLEVLFPGDPANEATAEEFERLKLEGYFDEPLFPDVHDTVNSLKGMGINVAVSSNNFQHLVEIFVEKKEIPFDIVLGFRDGFAKGADHFRHIEETLGIDCRSITFVGDSIKDGERAKGYGVEFIAKEGIFTRNEFQREFPGVRVISKLSELTDMFSARGETQCTR